MISELHLSEVCKAITFILIKSEQKYFDLDTCAELWNTQFKVQACTIKLLKSRIYIMVAAEKLIFCDLHALYNAVDMFVCDWVWHLLFERFGWQQVSEYVC